jgi:hypothetical protein
MKANMGTADRVIRIIVAIIIAILYFTNQITGVAAIVLGIFAIVLLITSMTSNCLLYKPFKISTKKKEESAA